MSIVAVHLGESLFEEGAPDVSVVAEVSIERRVLIMLIFYKRQEVIDDDCVRDSKREEVERVYSNGIQAPVWVQEYFLNSLRMQGQR